MKIKQRTSGGTYYVHFTGTQGERLRISTGTSDATAASLKAAEIVRDYLVDKPTEGPQAASGERLDTVGAMLRHAWLVRWKGQRSEAVIKDRLARLTREIGHWPRASVTTAKIREALDTMTTFKFPPRPLSAASKNRYTSMISTAFTVAKESDAAMIIPPMPYWRENNVKERYVTPEEEQTALDWFGLNTTSVERVYLRDLFLLLIDSGMRCGEALQELDEKVLIDIGDGRMALHLRHGMTKSGKGRIVPLTPRALDAARRMLASSVHGKWTSQIAGRYWRRAVDAMGIKDVTLHTLRHTTASRLVQAGVELYLVSTWLGHSSMEVTRRYAHLRPSVLAEAAGVLDLYAGKEVFSPVTMYPVAAAHPVLSGTLRRSPPPPPPPLTH